METELEKLKEDARMFARKSKFALLRMDLRKCQIYRRAFIGIWHEIKKLKKQTRYKEE